MPEATDKTICVIGLGYIGLPTAAVLASRGYTVRGVDLDPTIVGSIGSGQAHFTEPDLDMLVRGSVQSGRLTAGMEPTEADVFIICVPTPLAADRAPDLSHVHAAAQTIAPRLREGNLVVLESTSPPGTTEQVAQQVERASGLKPPAVSFVHAPERVLPGRILREVIENDRIIGGIDEPSTRAGAAFYRRFITGRLLLTSSRTAEAVKLIENAFRDVNIAFANELSILADQLGLNVWEMIRLANHHPRVNILRPGPGVGGHCIAVDPYFLAHAAPEATPLIQQARRVNQDKPRHVVQRVVERARRFKQPKVACLGLTYKPDVDDLRESPAIGIVRHLREALPEGRVLAVEPNIQCHPELETHDLEAAIGEADIVAALVAHRQFVELPRHLLTEKVVIDTCGVWSEE